VPLRVDRQETEMTYDAERYHRRSIRLKHYDYSQASAYFVTVCTHNKDCIFGDVVNGEMQLNENGSAVQTEWLTTAEFRDNVESDVFVVMPNHFHAVLLIKDNSEGTARCAPTSMNRLFGRITSGSLAAIMRSFKSAATKRVNELRNTPGAPVWQRNYYEHVVRDERDLGEIREYIVNNPRKWDLDKENPKNS